MVNPLPFQMASEAVKKTLNLSFLEAKLQWMYSIKAKGMDLHYQFVNHIYISLAFYELSETPDFISVWIEYHVKCSFS